MCASNRRSAGAFTLVELLAVLAIISLLVAILVPSLGRVREMAKRAPCMANLKHMGEGFLGYAAANNQWCPPSNVTLDPGREIIDWSTGHPVLLGYHLWSKGYWVWYWADFMAPYFDADAKPTDSAGRGSSSIGAQPGDGNYNRLGSSAGWLNTGVIVSRRMKCPAQTANTKESWDNPWNYEWYKGSWGGWAIEWWNGGQANIESTKAGEVDTSGRPTWPRYVGAIPNWVSVGRPRPGMDAVPERMVQVVEPFDGGSVVNYPWEGWTANGQAGGRNFIRSMPHAGFSSGAFQDGHVEPFSAVWVDQYLQDSISRAQDWNSRHSSNSPVGPIYVYPFAVPPTWWDKQD